MTELNPAHVNAYAIALLRVLEALQQLSPEAREELEQRMGQ